MAVSIPEERDDRDERNIKEQIFAEAAIYEKLIGYEPFKYLEKKINEKLSMEITIMLNKDTSDEEAFKARHFARGLQNVIDMVYTAIETAKKIRLDEEQDGPDGPEEATK